MSEQQVIPPAGAPPEARADRRLRISISSLLGLTLAGLVSLTLALVITMDFVAGRSATLVLIREKGELVLSGLERSVRDLMLPAESQLAFLAGAVTQAGRTDEPDQTRIIDLLTGGLAAAPQIARLVLLEASGRALIVQRGADRSAALVLDLSGDPSAQRGLEEASRTVGGYWGELIYDEVLRRTLINRRYSLWRDGRFVGVLASFVTTGRLSDTIAQESAEFTGTQFILFDRDHVLAHARMTEAERGGRPGAPLPTLAAVGDPVLAAIWSPPVEARVLGRDAGFHVIAVEGERFIFLERVLHNFGPVPWRLGVYYRASDLGQELRTLLRSALAGVGVLVAAVICAILLGRRLARPIRRVAQAANTLQSSGYSRFEMLPGSHVREIDDQIRAFNAMQAGLRWFRAYVPRTVVRRLMTDPDGATAASKLREVTVMFTDIVGFTSMSETMEAGDTAALLNHHFEIVTRAVEDETGTVDKFIGDSVMAFWNAPKHQPDHAERAVRAVLAIAQALRIDNAERIASGRQPIRIRVGIHTGPVVVGNIGASGRINYTIVGDTVNTAQRLQGLGREVCRDSRDATILLSGATVEQLPSGLPLEFAGTFNLRGRAGPIDVYQLGTSVEPAASRAARAAVARDP